jgi:hypothetical protein
MIEECQQAGPRRNEINSNNFLRTSPYATKEGKSWHDSFTAAKKRQANG